MAEVNEGDWVEGEVQWWWKYVLPAREKFWLAILAARLDPVPEPWRQGLVGEILEGVAMLQASARVRQGAVGARLKSEGLDKISHAVKSAQGPG
jgi:hypothetical protein